MTEKNYLKDVYALKSVADTQSHYDGWSASYDADMDQNRYATPGRIAAALADLMGDQSLPILDFGCGTGMSGAALKAAGFQTIDGCDLSDGMLDRAREKRAYRKLWRADPAHPLPVHPGDYAAITAVGVVSIGAAPPETMDMLINALAPGGLFAFSFNGHTLQDPRFAARVQHHLDTGTCALTIRNDGEHLPGINLRSTIFVLRRR